MSRKFSVPSSPLHPLMATSVLTHVCMPWCPLPHSTSDFSLSMFIMSSEGCCFYICASRDCCFYISASRHITRFLPFLTSLVTYNLDFSYASCFELFVLTLRYVSLLKRFFLNHLHMWIGSCPHSPECPLTMPFCICWLVDLPTGCGWCSYSLIVASWWLLFSRDFTTPQNDIVVSNSILFIQISLSC